jgi:hypothetical protein
VHYAAFAQIPPQPRIAELSINGDGTGTARFENSSQIFHFNHTMTPQNGYIYENNTAYYPNGTRIDLSNFDFAQIALTENSTLTATIHEPTTEPTTTTALSQSNSTSGGLEGGPTIRSLQFLPDGTGWLTLDSVSGRIIRLHHTLTAANGYTYDNYARAPFFANNGTKVDLNSIDFSSQVTIDPNENVTLPAHPKISPYVEPEGGVSSLPPSSSPAPSTEAAPLTTTTTPTPPSLPPALYSGLTSDPELVRFNEILSQCSAKIVELNPLGEGGQFQQPNQSGLDDVRQCVMALEQAVTKYCEDFETYDAAKCSYVNTPNIKQWLDAAQRIVNLGSALNMMTGQ